MTTDKSQLPPLQSHDHPDFVDGRIWTESEIEAIQDCALAALEQVQVAQAIAVEAVNEELLNAVRAMRRFLDRDFAIGHKTIELKCESHDQAWNYIHEMRAIVDSALKTAAPTQGVKQ